jgi:hypothetical protein
MSRSLRRQKTRCAVENSVLYVAQPLRCQRSRFFAEKSFAPVENPDFSPAQPLRRLKIGWIEWICGCAGGANDFSPSQRLRWRGGGWDGFAVKFPASRWLLRRGERCFAGRFVALPA